MKKFDWKKLVTETGFLLIVTCIMMAAINHFSSKAGFDFSVNYLEALLITLLFRLTRKV